MREAVMFRLPEPTPPPRLDDVALFGCFFMILLGLVGAALMRAALEPF